MEFNFTQFKAQWRVLQHHHGRSTTCPLEDICSSAETNYSKVAKALCFWCLVGHLSQLHHDVFLMMGEEEKVRYCLLEAVELLRPEEGVKVVPMLYIVWQMSAPPGIHLPFSRMHGLASSGKTSSSVMSMSRPSSVSSEKWPFFLFCSSLTE